MIKAREGEKKKENLTYYPFEEKEIKTLLRNIENGTLTYVDVDDKYLETLSNLIEDAFVKKDPKNLKIFTTLQSDAKYAEMAVQRNGLALEYFDEKIKNSEDIVSKAILNNGEAFKLASYRLRGDKNFVLFSVQQNPKNFGYTASELRTDITFIISLVQNVPNIYYEFNLASFVDPKSEKLVPLQGVYNVKFEALRYSKSSDLLRYMIRKQLVTLEEPELFYISHYSDYNSSKEYLGFRTITESMKLKLSEYASLAFKKGRKSNITSSNEQLEVESVFFYLLETLLDINTFYTRVTKKGKVKRMKMNLEEFLIMLLKEEKEYSQNPTNYPFLSKICIEIYTKYVDQYAQKNGELVIKKASKIYNYQNKSSPKKKKKKKNSDSDDNILLDYVVNGKLRHSFANLKL